MKVIYSPRSYRDLKKICEFIAAESGSQQVAHSYIARLLDACDALAILPERYAHYRYARDWRMMPFGNYLIFFQVRDETVRIGHVRHGAMKSFRG